MNQERERERIRLINTLAPHAYTNNSSQNTDSTLLFNSRTQNTRSTHRNWWYCFTLWASSLVRSLLVEGNNCSPIRCHHFGIGGHLCACICSHVAKQSTDCHFIYVGHWAENFKIKYARCTQVQVQVYMRIYVCEQRHYRLAALALLHF